TRRAALRVIDLQGNRPEASRSSHSRTSWLAPERRKTEDGRRKVQAGKRNIEGRLGTSVFACVLSCLRLPSPVFQHPISEIIAYPDREFRPAEPLASTVEPVQRCLVREHVVFPAPVQQGAPRPVEVDWETERERLEAETVRRVAIDQAEPRDRGR